MLTLRTAAAAATDMTNKQQHVECQKIKSIKRIWLLPSRKSQLSCAKRKLLAGATRRRGAAKKQMLLFLSTHKDRERVRESAYDVAYT